MKNTASQATFLAIGLLLSGCAQVSSPAPSAGAAQPLATNSCTISVWQEQTNYGLGDIVRYPRNGKFYRVQNTLPDGTTDRTDPTLSPYFWKEILTWQEQTNYGLGDIVRYPANGRFYRVQNTLPDGTTDRTDPTLSPYFWADLGSCAAPGDPTPPPAAGTLPGKVLAGYYPNWIPDAPRLRDIDPNYNLVYLFDAVQAPGQAAGTLQFDLPTGAAGTNWKADLQYARTTQGKRFLLSVGGANAGFRLTDRATSENFVRSVEQLYQAWGGFDGLDFNNFEADVTPNTSEMIWAAKRLKELHPGFIISAPPAPWKAVDQQFCKDMLSAGALDYCAPQYYDSPDLVKPDWVKNNIGTWMSLLGPEHVVVGFGIAPGGGDYWSVDSAASTFTQIKAQYPNVKEAFAWQLVSDAAQGYPFAKRFSSLSR